jgi:hypothetical protein
MAAGRPPALGSGFHAGLSQIGNSPKDLPFRTTKLKQYGFDPHKPHSDNSVNQDLVAESTSSSMIVWKLRTIRK